MANTKEEIYKCCGCGYTFTDKRGGAAIFCPKCREWAIKQTVGSRTK